jgi:anaerobic magnesium-protoporphyrin IX monomethyl ester cyclase
MRILFVEKQIDYEPQGIMSLSAYLKRAGHEVALAIASQEDPVAFACRYEPDVVGYSVMTGSQRWYLSLNLRIKEALRRQGKEVFSAFGGPHPTFFPEMIQEEGVDGLCIGEGEGALLDLADSLANGKVRTDIPNWWFKTEEGIIRNPVRPLIRDLDSLPLPDRALIYDKHAATRRSPIKHFISSRGCPYNCTYCFNHAYYTIYAGERRVHQRSVGHVIQEVKEVKERWPLQHVVFMDDLFIIRDDWLEELAERWPSEVGLPFFCNVRADLIVRRPHKVRLLQRAGCVTVSMGIETANDRIRNDLLKRRMGREEIIRAAHLFRQAGIHVTATNMLALPTGTLEDDLETMRLNAQARISYAHAFLFQPYPGTQLGDFARERGLMTGGWEDISAVAWERSPLVFNSEGEKRQVEHLQRLFALGVEFPRLEPLIRRLIRLPDHPLVSKAFWWVHKLWKGYAIFRRVHPIKVGVADLFRVGLHFLRAES